MPHHPSDPFQDKHKADARSANQKAAQEILDQRKAAATKRLLDNMKQPFNDLPRHKFKDVFKFSGPG